MTDDHSRRGELATKLCESGLTDEAAGTAAQLAKLSADPTGEEIDAEVQRILAAAKPEDFVADHQGQKSAFFRQYKADLVKEREAEGSRMPMLDERLAQGSGSATVELDRRLGRVPS